MSQMEYNKGKLFPTGMDWDEFFLVLGGAPSDLPDGYCKEEWCRNNCFDTNYVVLKDKIYKVVWEIERGDELPELLNLTKHSDGSVDFETYHYNGGGCWEEIVEGSL